METGRLTADKVSSLAHEGEQIMRLAETLEQRGLWISQQLHAHFDSYVNEGRVPAVEVHDGLIAMIALEESFRARERRTVLDAFTESNVL